MGAASSSPAGERRPADRPDASSEAPHFQYRVSGRLVIRIDDGSEFTAGPGDITSLPSGSTPWVVGDESVVLVEWFGASNYARCSAEESPEPAG